MSDQKNHELRRIDSAGRDVTDLYGLQDETDTFEPAEPPARPSAPTPAAERKAPEIPELLTREERESLSEDGQIIYALTMKVLKLEAENAELNKLAALSNEFIGQVAARARAAVLEEANKEIASLGEQLESERATMARLRKKIEA